MAVTFPMVSVHSRCKLCGLTRRISPRTQQRFQSTATAEATRTTETEETISPPHVEGRDKIYSSKIENIVNEISNLTLLEVADLNDLLKVHYDCIWCTL